MTNQPNGAPAPTNDDPPAVMRHGEAPYSANIKTYDPEGFDMMFTIRDEDGARFIERVNRLRSWLVREGFTPTRTRSVPTGDFPPAPTGHAAPQYEDATVLIAPDGVTPTCSLHGIMKQSTKYDGWYCPKRLSDDTYCQVTYKP